MSHSVKHLFSLSIAMNQDVYNVIIVSIQYHIGKYLHKLSIYKVYIQTTNCLSHYNSTETRWKRFSILRKIWLKYSIIHLTVQEQKVNTY